MTTTTNAPLLGTAELAADLDAWAGSPDRRILEVDEDTDAYARGHLPGALAVHWRDDLQDPVRRDFIGPEAFAALMDRLGVGNDTQVVLYGGSSNWFAAYAYWYFRFYGHRAVRLLDGGRKTWELEGRPLTTEVPEPAPGHGYRVGGPVTEIRALRGQVLEAVRNGDGAALVDVRSPEEYRGEVMAPPHLPQEAAQRPGHIPGAVNIPWAKAVDPETGTFLPAGQLRSLYEGQGLTPDREVIAYCRIGERSAHTWFVLHELLGYPRVRNYDGSWTEWGSLVGAPIERGPPMNELWDLWFPNAGATGLSFARSRVGADAAGGRVLVHAAPRHLEVVVRNDQGEVVAEGRGLRRGAPGPMSLLVRDGATIRLRDHWPTEDDLGVLVILPGGEAGILTSWWHAPDHSEWRWQLELSNRQTAPEALVASTATGR